jgi:PKD repeat protein
MDIVSWSWAFKDGGQQIFLSGPTPNHTFSRVGIYVVTLTVTDSAGLTDMVQFNIVIEDTVRPTADAGGPYSVMEGERLVLDGTASSDNVEVVAYSWTFNYKMEPVVLEGSQPVFTFDIPGTYTIALTVSDNSGNNHTAETKVTVNSEGGDGNGGGTDDGGLGSLAIYIALAVIVVVVAAVLVLRSRGGPRTPKDMGWTPSDEERKERENGPGKENSEPGPEEGAEKG